MISLIIPTLWKYEEFPHFLEMMMRIPVVKEVHIINNYVEKTPDCTALKNPKIVMHNQPKNIGVHPAWNFGVESSSAENVCLCSDDVVFDLKLLFEVDDFLNSDLEDNTGIVAMRTSFILFQLHSKQIDEIGKIDSFLCDQLTVTGNIKFKQMDIPEPGHGALFFCKKKNWIEIPKELVKDYGDVFEWYAQVEIGRKNYSINDCFFYHKVSTTSRCEDSDYNGLVVDYEHEHLEGFTKIMNRWRTENNLPILDYP